jgi:hypothetical protein
MSPTVTVCHPEDIEGHSTAMCSELDLSFKRGRLGSAGLADISNFVRGQLTLKTLRLSGLGEMFSEQGDFNNLATALRDHRSLEYVSLGHNPLNDEHVRALLGAVKNSTSCNLNVIYLGQPSGEQVPDLMAELASELEQNYQVCKGSTPDPPNPIST